jgi:hypothetical protein
MTPGQGIRKAECCRPAGARAAARPLGELMTLVVDAVWIEPVSRDKFPYVTEKEREFSQLTANSMANGLKIIDARDM